MRNETKGRALLRRTCGPVLATAVTALAVAACQGSDPLAVRLETLEAHEATWASLRPEAYTFTLLRHCECLEAATGPVVVTVDGATAVSRVYEASGEPVPDHLQELFPTVEGLFAVIRDALENHYNVTVTYLEDTGVPHIVTVEPDVDVGDDEFGYTVTQSPVPTTLAS